MSVLGRENELAALERVLEQARSGTAGVLVLTGPAGIGKTTLLDAACRAAPDFGCTRIAGHEAEADLAWAGVASLLLAWPDRDAPELALLRDVVGGARRSAVAVGSALHAAIIRRSERQPVLLAIDDAQWLDPASAEAFAFAAHRFAADRVAVLVAQRDGPRSRFAGAAEFAVDALARVQCRALVRSRFTLPATVVDRCIELSGGNPLALLHVCESLTPDQRSGQRPVDALGALPERLRAAFDAKLDELPDATLRALAVIAASSEIDRLEGVLAALDATPGDLLAAEAAGVVALDGRPRFTHPLWSNAVIERIPAALRRRVHQVLATHSGDPDRAALHRAAGADHSDERIARELDALALRATERGLPALAARAWRDAAQLSETPDPRHAREVAAAQAFWHASMPGAALATLDRTIPELADERARAEAVLLRNKISSFTEDARGGALALRAEADRVRGRLPDLEFELLSAATVAALLAADATLGLEVSARAIDVAGDDASRLTALALRGYAAVHRGDDSDAGAIEVMESLAALPFDDVSEDQLELQQLAGYVLLVRDRWDDAERTLRAVIAGSSRRGLASVEAFSHALLAELDFRRGRWLDALTDATFDIALTEGREESRAPFGHAVAAHVFAHLGDAAQCAERAHFALRLAEQLGLWSVAAFARAALGASALADGDTAGAVAQLGGVWEIRRRGGVTESSVVWYQGDYIEALLAEGRRDEAAEIVRETMQNAGATRGRWATAVATRGTALLGKASPDEAIQAAIALGAPFELARTRLALVESSRCDARKAGIDVALATFERLGARPWAARARALLGAADESPPSLAQQLTHAELRVALLIGRGATNAAASETLVLSVRTVDAHLRSIYRKLGIRSRSELVLRVATEGGRSQSNYGP